MVPSFYCLGPSFKERRRAALVTIQLLLILKSSVLINIVGFNWNELELQGVVREWLAL